MNAKGAIIDGEREIHLIYIIKGERRKKKSASKRLVKLDELANNFAIKREQSQTTQERTQNQTCLNYAERQGGKQ